jgi:UPF0271 protein
MRMKTDINCDMGEGMPDDAFIMPYISSANIACGAHAGDTDSIQETIELALQYSVRIGAHISYPDREHFGRRVVAMEAAALQDSLLNQLYLMERIAGQCGCSVQHVKPHGALYNQAAADSDMARLIADTLQQFNDGIPLFALSGSKGAEIAAAAGITVWQEVFADRRYQADGSLTPRSEAGAVLDDAEELQNQVRSLIEQGTVRTREGSLLHLHADTICMHGDHPQARRNAALIGRLLAERT